MRVQGKNQGIIPFLMILIAIGWVVRLCHLDHFTLDHFFDRDLYRAILLDSHSLIYGPEVTGGGATPGTAYTLFLAALFKLSFGNIFVFYFYFCFLQLLGLFFFLKVIRKHFGFPTALWAFFFTSASYFYHETFLALWNPTFAFIWIFISYALLLDLLIEKKHRNFTYLLILAGIEIQFHISNIFLLLLLLSSVLIYRIKIPFRYISYGALGFLLPYIPFLISEFWLEPQMKPSFKVDDISDIDSPLHLYLRILANLFNVIVFANDGGVQWTFRSHFLDWPVLKPWKWAFTLITALPLVLSLRLFKKVNWKKSQSVVLTLLLISLPFLALTMIFSHENGEINIRRHLWCLPVTVTFLSLGMNAIWERIKAGSVMKYGFYAVIIVYTFFQLTYLSVNHQDIAFHEAYTFKREIVQIARDKYHFDDFSIQHYVGLIARGTYIQWDSRDWTLKSLEKSDSSGVMSILHTEKKNALATRAGFCLMVIRNKSSIEANEKEFSRENLEEFLKRIRYAEVNILDITYTAEGVYFTHPKINYNCSSFYKNFYYIAERDQLSSLSHQDLTSSLPYAEYDDETGVRRYFFRKELEGIEYDYIFEFEKAGSSLRGKLYIDSRWLYYDYNANSDFLHLIPMGTSVIFRSTSDSRKEYRLELFPELKKVTGFFSTPYFFVTGPVPSGPYQMDLEIQQNGKETFRIQLESGISF